MSANNYMPYIEWAMIHIQRIYTWNEKVDEMRGITKREYDFNQWLKLYYEERGEYTLARLASDPLEAVDAIVDQFVVAIGEIRKCALSDEYDKIDFWEDKAIVAYDHLYDTFWDIDDSIDSAHIKRDKALTAVIDALFTRFGDDAYIDENGKFIKSKWYTKPDLSFLLWNQN